MRAITITKFNVMHSLSLLALAALVSLAPSIGKAQTEAEAPKAPQTPQGNSENGKKLFDSYGCYECHGHQGEGAPGFGARLAPNPISLAALVRYVRHPLGQMPPVTAKVVSDADLADIYAYLQSIPQPPKADTIPALK